MRSTHLHAVRLGRSGAEPGRLNGLRNEHVVAKGVRPIRVVFAWLLLASVGVSAPMLASAQAGAGSQAELVGARSESASGYHAPPPRSALPLAARVFKSASDS